MKTISAKEFREIICKAEAVIFTWDGEDNDLWSKGDYTVACSIELNENFSMKRMEEAKIEIIDDETIRISEGKTSRFLPKFLSITKITV
jgi:hypothetical protein